MNWDDKGFILSKNKYNENSIIAEIFTENHGKCSGIIFGASSKKIKNYLQIGNKIHLNHTFKNESKIGYFKVEIITANSPLYFDDKNKLMCLCSAMGLIKLLTVEAQSNKRIFDLIDDFFKILKEINWLEKYIFWELELLKLIGFDLELKKIVNVEIIDNKKIYFVENSVEKKIVPNFLIDKNNGNTSLVDLKKGFKLVGDFLDKNVLKPNNISLPVSRVDLTTVFK